MFRPLSDVKIDASEFATAVDGFKKAVREFQAAVDRMDTSIAAAMEFVAAQDLKERRD
jgi:hypothetical protein